MITSSDFFTDEQRERFAETTRLLNGRPSLAGVSDRAKEIILAIENGKTPPDYWNVPKRDTSFDSVDTYIPLSLREELMLVLNKHSKKNAGKLADYLLDCLDALMKMYDE